MIALWSEEDPTDLALEALHTVKLAIAGTQDCAKADACITYWVCEILVWLYASNIKGHPWKIAPTGVSIFN